MKFQTIKYFIVLAEELHFSKAASRLSITQPPLSTAIKTLEEELGVTLFNRNKTSVELTEVGHAFLHEAIKIIESAERAKQVAISTSLGARGQINIGFCGTLIFRDIIIYIKNFKSKNQKIIINLQEMNTQQQVESLQQGRIQLGFMYGYEPPQPLSYMPWKEDYFALCIPSSHPLAEKESLRLSDFSNEEFIMFERNINPKNFDSVMQNFAREKFNPKIGFQTKNWMTSLSMVSEGCGVAIIPLSLQRMQMQGIKIIPLQTDKVISPSCVAWNSDRSNMATQHLINYLKLEFQPNSF